MANILTSSLSLSTTAPGAPRAVSAPTATATGNAFATLFATASPHAIENAAGTKPAPAAPYALDLSVDGATAPLSLSIAGVSANSGSATTVSLSYRAVQPIARDGAEALLPPSAGAGTTMPIGDTTMVARPPVSPRVSPFAEDNASAEADPTIPDPLPSRQVLAAPGTALPRVRLTPIGTDTDDVPPDPAAPRALETAAMMTARVVAGPARDRPVQPRATDDQSEARTLATENKDAATPDDEDATPIASCLAALPAADALPAPTVAVPAVMPPQRDTARTAGNGAPSDAIAFAGAALPGRWQVPTPVTPQPPTQPVPDAMMAEGAMVEGAVALATGVGGASTQTPTSRVSFADVTIVPDRPRAEAIRADAAATMSVDRSAAMRDASVPPAATPSVTAPAATLLTDTVAPTRRRAPGEGGGDAATVIGSLTGTNHTTHAPVPATGDAQPRLDMTRHDWPATMIERIDALRDAANQNDTSIRLTPDALGTIDIRLVRDDDGVSVRFAAQSADTRALLADAQPRLVELADARGLKLSTSADGNAGQSPSQQQHQSRTPSAPPSARTIAADARQPDASSGNGRIA